MSPIPIPDGYELLSGRGRDNAAKALATAKERGLDSSTVLTTQDGYLIPLQKGEVDTPGDESEDVDPDVAALSAYIEERNLTPAAVLEILSQSQAEVVEITLPKVTDKVADVEAFAAEHNIDISAASNNEERIAAINAEIERRTVEAEQNGTLTGGTEPAKTEKEN